MNLKPQTIFTADNLSVLRGMNSECVDLIYLDPPFNSNRNYSAPIGSKAAGAAFKDTWTLDDLDLAWLGQIAEQNEKLYTLIHAAGLTHGKGMKSYLIMMAVRLLEMHRVLKSSGSVYLHCDPTASHYLKMLMDSIFGKGNFRNEVLWVYNRFSRQGRGFPSMHDILLFYGKTKNFVFNKQEVAPRNSTRYEIGYHTVVDRGEKKLLVYDKKKAGEKIKQAEQDGVKITYTKAKNPVMGNVWSDIPIINPRAKERLGYPTQKPLALVERIIKASSNEGDLVLDPFCGCATACIAAEQWRRKWIGIDLSPLAFKLVNRRFETELDLFNPKIIHRTDIPQRTDIGKIPKYTDKKNKQQLYGEQDGLCNGCRIHFPYRNLTIDHIVADTKGGTDHLSNLQLLCGACNSTKGDGTQEELIARLRASKII